MYHIPYKEILLAIDYCKGQGNTNLLLKLVRGKDPCLVVVHSMAFAEELRQKVALRFRRRIITLDSLPREIRNTTNKVPIVFDNQLLNIAFTQQALLVAKQKLQISRVINTLRAQLVELERDT